MEDDKEDYPAGMESEGKTIKQPGQEEILDCSVGFTKILSPIPLPPNRPVPDPGTCLTPTPELTVDPPLGNSLSQPELRDSDNGLVQENLLNQTVEYSYQELALVIV
ncbi:hypothetical protein DSO57_1009927 [Entomophthora muscae]|uniref:Uncharacterized protein n=1 Tax=Entomophthora muscae TaxID=34485 RepID=A0ACC2SVI8_9FUNG|nr:hypothetical protein DSO57_1009927 [Entomophthora muscae]